MKPNLFSQKSNLYGLNIQNPNSHCQEQNIRISDCHINPLKIKTSFIRQSLNSSMIDTKPERMDSFKESNMSGKFSQSGNLADQQHYSSKQEELLQKKILNRFSLECGKESQTGKKEVIRLTGRRSEAVSKEKENYWMRENSPRPVSQEKQRLDSHFKNKRDSYTLSQVFNEGVISNSHVQDFSVSVASTQLQTKIQDQLNSIVKRLAKNQCEIETLKREKIDGKIEYMCRQIDFCQKQQALLTSKQSKIEDNVISFGQILQKFNAHHKEALEKSAKSLRDIVESIEITSKKLLEQNYKKDQRICQIEVSVNSLKTQLSDVSQKQEKGKSQNETVAGGLLCTITSEINDLKLKLQQFEHNSQKVCRQSSLRRTNKVCPQSIQLSYLQLLKAKNSEASLFSDRSKLLTNACHQGSLSNGSVYQQQRLKRQNGASKVENTTMKSLSKSSKVNDQIVLCEEQYFIDQEGYLLNSDHYYLIDDSNQQVKIEQSMINVLREKGLLVLS